MKFEGAPIQTKGLARQIADQLRQAIIEGQLKAGDRLPTEEELSRRYGVSRPTIREALKRLAAQKLVRSRRGPSGGTFINQLDAADVAEGLGTGLMLMVGLGEVGLEQVAEARHALESLCLGLAVERRGTDELEKMAREIEHQRDPATTDEEFCASDVRFHQALAEASGNPVLKVLAGAVLESLQPATNLLIYRHRDRAQVVAQHTALLGALERRSVVDARAALDELMETLRDQYARVQEERGRT
ncbi:MAG: FadR/GntR family transcriptional regulator [Gammaproteobacteria bacterium]